MRALVLGATGYIGSVVAERLQAAGHDVVAMVRPDGDGVEAAPDVPVVAGDLTDPESLTAAVTDDIDAVVHVATPTGDEATDLAAISALLAPLRSTGRALIYTSGVWVLGATAGRVAEETTPANAIPLVAYRPRIEAAVLDAAGDGVRSVVLRPGIAHGRGAGIPSMLVGWAQEHGEGTYVGEPDVRWPMVHVDDLADLFVAALERARPGAVLHGVAEIGVPAAALAEAAAASAGVGGRVTGRSVQEMAATIGAPFAEALALDQVVSSERTREAVGWSPTRSDAVTDIRNGSYAGALKAAS